MFSQKDKNQIKKRGNSLDLVNQQIDNFSRGFPYLKIERAATIGDGIIKLDDKEVDELPFVFDQSIREGKIPVKFIPASGAASRMFKDLFEALQVCEGKDDSDEVLAQIPQARDFFMNRDKFAFYNDLKILVEKHAKVNNCENWLYFLLGEKGLNYGNLPKGLLKFHKYPDGERTPFEEHLVEGVYYAKDNNNIIRLFFTVSPEHERLFSLLFSKIKRDYKQKYGVEFDVTFSVQKASTDTIAVDMDNNPFRKRDGKILFRPGGHGALIENLNELDADFIFIKNIDNVVPDRLKQVTYDYKKALAGVLIRYQERLFYYQKELNEKHYLNINSAFLAEAANFMENIMNVKPPCNMYYTEKKELCYYLKEKFNRPMRVCGMVKKEGEPGGGPFFAGNADGTISLQIVENSQIDPNDSTQKEIVKESTHFNPVDIVCGVNNYKGEKFDLTQFLDPATGFITTKYKDGNILKAQELPGLWNGAMSDWNTIFVEVPASTFNPVKTVNDLLRDEHL